MSSIILAFIIGAFVGGGIMYMRYRNMVIDNLRELRELRMSLSRIKGKLEMLCILNKMEGDIE